MVNQNKILSTITLILFTLFFKSTTAQINESFNLKLYNGTLQSFPLTDINKITFSNNSLILSFNNSTILSWSTSIIDYYYYQSTPTFLNENQKNCIDVKISPNPTSSKLFISGSSLEMRQINLKVYDNLGKLVFQDFIPVANGIFSQSIDVSSFKKGMYSFIFYSKNNNSVIKKVLINE
jgi:hypothetical protein